jgi:hypothetical protein
MFLTMEKKADVVSIMQIKFKLLTQRDMKRNQNMTYVKKYRVYCGRPILSRAVEAAPNRRPRRQNDLGLALEH